MAGSLFCSPGKRFLAPAALLVLSSLMACGGAPEASAPPPPAPAPPAQPAEAAGAPATAPAPTGAAAAPAAASAPPALLAGLTPLPSKQQVLAAAPTDRPDPFAPVIRPQSAGAAAGAASRPAGPGPLRLPEDFRFSGVIAIAGVPQALVQRSEQSGSVVVGDQGGRSTRLIPNGWVVTEIDVQNGRLRMRLGKQTISAALRPT
ncbi:hypothetical protein KBY97_13190 [Synechococcus sp. ATX 2A4]|uniref:hypothetical protein n=1 Tax=Synechococcus sp. ATX 2A4 TaxID=2823727 RepID=UPI0020CDA612|nr:hypothetical protein [Synechococcus sp. ATX 2A4]MCP9886069.1 hypothetical protein [Synechococcus sp. ATX 2A4]